MENDNGYAGGASSLEDESMSSSPKNGPYGGKGLDDENVSHEQELGGDSDYMSDFRMGSHDEHEYHGDSDMDMGHDEDYVESQGPTGSYSESMSEVPVHSQNEDVHHWNSNMNTGHDEDRRARYCQIMEEAASIFYNNYAKEHGFNIRK